MFVDVCANFGIELAAYLECVMAKIISRQA